MKDDAVLCPSHRCIPGSQLLGVRQNNGKVAILPQILPINKAFIDKAKQHPMTPERRFRFTNKCIEGGCKQWNGKGCNVAERIVQHLEKVLENGQLPSCAIRDNCRWYRQKGSVACKVCSHVLTDVTENKFNNF